MSRVTKGAAQRLCSERLERLQWRCSSPGVDQTPPANTAALWLCGVIGPRIERALKSLRVELDECWHGLIGPARDEWGSAVGGMSG